MVAPSPRKIPSETQMIQEFDPLISHIALSKARKNPRLESHIDDLIQEARTALFLTLKNHPNKSLDDKYLRRVIRNAMFDYIRNLIFLKRADFRPRRLHNRILEFLDELGIPKTKETYIQMLVASIEETGNPWTKDTKISKKAAELWDEFGPTPAATKVLTHLSDETHRQPSVSSSQISEADRAKIRELFLNAMLRNDSQLLQILFASLFQDKNTIEIAAELRVHNSRISQIINNRKLKDKLRAQASQLVRTLEELH